MQVRLHSRRFLAGFRPTPWDGLAFALIFGLLLLFGHGVREAWQPLAILQAEPVRRRRPGYRRGTDRAIVRPAGRRAAVGGRVLEFDRAR